MKTKRYNNRVGALCGALGLILLSAAGANEPIKVYLLGGQSNMVGAGKPAELSGLLAKPQEDVKFWTGNAWGPLAPGATNFGPEISFGRAMKDALPKEEIYLVKYAAGGTALYNDWSPSGGRQYAGFMHTVRAALANLDQEKVKYEIAGMLWMQGESDAKENQAETYAKNMRDFITHMREQFKTPGMPFVIARVRDHYGGATGQAKIVRDAQVDTAKTTEGVEWFDTDDYPMVNAGHYNGKGLVIMGKDFAKAILAVKPPRPSTRTFHSAATAYPSGLVLMKSGEIMPRGWMLEQMRKDLREGFVGRYDTITGMARMGLFAKAKADYKTPLPPGARETWWSAEVEGQWMESLIRLAHLTQDREYQQKAKNWVEDILKHQGEDGYIGIYKPGLRFNHEVENGELWVMSRAMLGMLAHAEFTDDKRCIEAIRRAVDLVMEKYPEGSSYFKPGKQGGVTHGLAFVDLLEWFHRHTGEDRYARFAEFLYLDYNAHAKRDRAMALDDLLEPGRVFFGHGAHVAEQFMIPFFLAGATGKETYRKASERALENYRFHHCPGGSINSVEQVDGRSGSADRFREYCTFKSFTLSLSRVAMITADSEVADWAERIVMNAAQGSRKHPALTANAYCSSDNRVSIDVQAHGGRLMYSACHGAAPCCAVSAGQLLPLFVEAMWMRQQHKDELVAMQYGPSVLKTGVAGSQVVIEQKTAYPFSDDLIFSIEPERPVEFTLTLRRPGHVEALEIEAPPGARISSSEDFIRIHKQWRKGDELRVHFRCPIRMVPHPESESVPGAGGGHYLQRGPLVYALPFPGEFHVLKELGDTGFKNFGVTTLDETGWDYAIAPDARFVLQRDPDPNRSDPWVRPPLRLIGPSIDQAGKEVRVTLVPLGATVLRRTAFPVPATRKLPHRSSR